MVQGGRGVGSGVNALERGLSGQLRNFALLIWEMEQIPAPPGVKAPGTVPGTPEGKRDLFILN